MLGQKARVRSHVNTTLETDSPARRRTPIPDDRIFIGNPLLLVIDVQHDFVDTDGRVSAGYAPAVIPSIRTLIESFRAADLPIIFTRESHRPGQVDGGLEPEYRIPEHCVEGTHGHDIVEDVAPMPSEMVIDKRRYSCFLGTELEFLLRKFRTDTLVVCGLTSDCCVHWTAGDAFQRDFHVRVVEDATAGTSPEAHEASLLILRRLTTRGRAIHTKDILPAIGGMP